MTQFASMRAIALTPVVTGRGLSNMNSKGHSFYGLSTGPAASLAKKVVAIAIAENARAGIPLTGGGDSRVQTLQATEPRIAKFLTEQRNVQPT